MIDGGGSLIQLQSGFWSTMLNTWFVMFILVAGSWWVTRGLRQEAPLSTLQHTLEILVEGITDQIKEIVQGDARPYIPFVGTVFLFIVVANILGIIPSVMLSADHGITFYHPPTAGLDTTVALALCVFVAVPFFAVRQGGIKAWLRGYIQPTPFMLPFNVIGDISRTIALAVRLFGNMMSGVVIVGILLSIAPLVFPTVMQLFGLLTGAIQAYIFAVLTMVYIASSVQVNEERLNRRPKR